MMAIQVRGAKTHNLKNIDVDIPHQQLTVITGLSGSGKSSLAFDTLYAEGQRRYVESLSAYARQFLALMEKPDVDSIEGLSPAIAIQQKATSHNPRSTVGTVTEIYDYLRLLFARIGEPYCPEHHIPLNAQTVSQIVDQILALADDSKIMILAPVIKDRKGEHHQLFAQLRSKGYLRARINGDMVELDDLPNLDPKKKHTIDVVIDRSRVKDEHQQRFSESIENALNLSEGLVIVASMENAFDDMLFSAHFSCPYCAFSLTELSPRLFSFNSPHGACAECDGLGMHEFIDESKVFSMPQWSIAQGAVGGWDKRSGYHFNMLSTLAIQYRFSVDTPFMDLPKNIQKIIMYGEPRGFQGVIPYLERRFRQADSTRREEYLKWLSEQPCPTCEGTRLHAAARQVKVLQYALPELCDMTIDALKDLFAHMALEGAKKTIAEKINQEILARLQFLIDVGLDYLNLSRSAETLSGGEAQRIRLASQIGSGLVGVMYVLDEPSIGLHQRDNQRLLDTLFHLRNLGNTVIVVEHDEDAIRHADHVIDIGPKAGVHGGEIVAQGKPSDIMSVPESLTGQYLSGQQKIEVPQKRHQATAEQTIRLRGVNCHNLKQVDVDIPLGGMVCVTGVSGSGKSSLINDTLYPLAASILNGAAWDQKVSVASYEGLKLCDKVIAIDQSPIGRTPRSNPATYTGLLTPIRELFAQTPEARARGYQPGRFSFNVKGGRCEACQGDGMMRVEMHFLPDIFVPCDICQGKRYNRETLSIVYKGKNIDEVLCMTVEDASEFFSAIPTLSRKCKVLEEVGLGYMTLGQSAVTLSGGEAQRIKLAKELSKRSTGQTLYILDEPTTGLHFHDIAQLLKVLQRLRDQGNTIVVIEHNLDVIKTADWIIDIGPEGGFKGGKIVAEGTPEKVAKVEASFTGQFLKKLL
ncbi:MAG: excinuclease ABC subunit UvrA [Gammaproteobacteria bacterium]|nr:excinuclease ABC subunit UvrA [Gammaproteobacteria bacterium]